MLNGGNGRFPSPPSAGCSWKGLIMNGAILIVPIPVAWALAHSAGARNAS